MTGVLEQTKQFGFFGRNLIFRKIVRLPSNINNLPLNISGQSSTILIASRACNAPIVPVTKIE